MLRATSCTVASVDLIDGTYPRIRFGFERPSCGAKRCGDCNVARGGLHHLGCDVERCPACTNQLISCGCFDEDVEETASWPTKESVAKWLAERGIGPA